MIYGAYAHHRIRELDEILTLRSIDLAILSNLDDADSRSVFREAAAAHAADRVERRKLQSLVANAA